MRIEDRHEDTFAWFDVLMRCLRFEVVAIWQIAMLSREQFRVGRAHDRPIAVIEQ